MPLVFLLLHARGELWLSKNRLQVLLGADMTGIHPQDLLLLIRSVNLDQSNRNKDLLVEDQT